MGVALELLQVVCPYAADRVPYAGQVLKRHVTGDTGRAYLVIDSALFQNIDALYDAGKIGFRVGQGAVFFRGRLDVDGDVIDKILPDQAADDIRLQAVGVELDGEPE